MRITTCTIMLFALVAGNAVADDSHYLIRVSGTLRDKLTADTAIVFWSPRSDIHPSRSFTVQQLPIKLPVDQFTGWPWYVDFRNSHDQVLFSVSLSKDLFDRPRTINILLNRPRPRINLEYLPGSVGYISSITNRMQYRDLPCWDNKTHRFRPASPPVITISDLDTGKQVTAITMEAGCMAEKWWGVIDDSIEFPNRHKLRLTVEHDSGGVFDTITTSRDVSLWPSLWRTQ